MIRRSATLGPYRALDATFEVRAPAGLAAVLADVLIDLQQPSDTIVRHRVAVGRSTRHHLEVRVDQEEATSRLDLDDALYAVISAVNRLASASTIDTHALLHGGAVVLEGRAVAFVGNSQAGKSTLTALCVRAGAGYLCDEVVAVTPEGLARPFHRPIGVRPNARDVLGLAPRPGPFRETDPRPGSSLGGLAEAAPLALVAVLDRTTPSDAPYERLSPAQALQILSNEVLEPKGYERAMFHRLRRFVDTTTVIRFTRRATPKLVDQAVLELAGQPQD